MPEHVISKVESRSVKGFLFMAVPPLGRFRNLKRNNVAFDALFAEESMLALFVRHSQSLASSTLSELMKELSM